MSVDEVITLQVHEALQKLPVEVVCPLQEAEQLLAGFHASSLKSGSSHSVVSQKPAVFFPIIWRLSGFVKKVIENWEVETTKRAKELGFANSGDIVVFTQGPSSGNPEVQHA